ncbi:primosomal protein [Actinotalea solisilvae]|uniref:primosomal protein n=1 Tax=Actinotalea solisilvae TaxID=2072922 RepID=UPI0018F1CC92|nr:primosomal protein [Actinotalea solisilvae]
MTDDPRAALDRLLAALEAHFHAVSTRRGDDDPVVDDAYDVLADAFEVYDNALLRVHGETLPFYLADDEADDDDADDDEADEDDDEVDEDDLDDLEDDLLDGTELDGADR